MQSSEIRDRFLKFFEKRGHKVIPSASLVPENDPSVLFTTAGMQQFKPYFVGATDPEKDFGSKNTVSAQKCIRTSDISEVGDDTHLTFFEMLGNFSFGGYFKKEAIQYGYDFIVKDLGLKIDYVTVFGGDSKVPKDEESEKIWRNLGVTDVRYGGMEDNFWGPTGAEGPCGPTTEIYIGGVEIWNIVFNEYYQHQDGRLEKLATPGVDTGMGLERLTVFLQNKNNVFETNLFGPIMKILSGLGGGWSARIVADHMRGIVFLIADGVRPGSKDQGSVLRRLIRRVIPHLKSFQALPMFEKGTPIPRQANLKILAEQIIDQYGKEDEYAYLLNKKEEILRVIEEEKQTFLKVYNSGNKLLSKLVGEAKDNKTYKITGVDIFDLVTTHGFALEWIKDSAKLESIELDLVEFELEFKKHQEISKTSVGGKFAGGLADHSEKTVRLHTAHHLLLAALQGVLGKEVKQRGSNINQERLRIDFSFDRKMTPEEIAKVEEIVNQKIDEGLAVERKEMPKEEALKLGAQMEFGAKYAEIVSVYGIKNPDGSYFSLEFCGGPHVSNTSELLKSGHFKIVKEEAVAAGARRIKAVLG